MRMFCGYTSLLETQIATRGAYLLAAPMHLNHRKVYLSPLTNFLISMQRTTHSNPCPRVSQEATCLLCPALILRASPEQTPHFQNQ